MLCPSSLDNHMSLEETETSRRQVQHFAINFHYTLEVQNHSIMLHVHSTLTCFTSNTTLLSLDHIIMIVVVTHVTVIDTM